MKRIVGALEYRYHAVNKLLNDGSDPCIIDAYEVFHSNLSLAANAVDYLISSEPVPPIPPFKWESTLDALASTIHRELDLLALQSKVA